MSLLIIIRDALIAMALSWVGVSLHGGSERSRADVCAGQSVNCTPQN